MIPVLPCRSGVQVHPLGPHTCVVELISLVGREPGHYLKGQDRSKRSRGTCRRISNWHLMAQALIRSRGGTGCPRHDVFALPRRHDVMMLSVLRQALSLLVPLNARLP